MIMGLCFSLGRKMYICYMDRNELNKNIINYLKPFHPERIALFGSYARMEDHQDSDIDILVSFKDTVTLLELARIHRELSLILGKKVDLITEKSLKNQRIKKHIYKDLQIIYE